MSKLGFKLSPGFRKFLLGFLAAIMVAYLGLGAIIWWAMHQPPETFGRVMARMPAPVVFLLYPFESLWTHARAGNLNIGDRVPNFSLLKIDKSGTLELATLNRQQPVVLVFGSYT
ncbi:MAG TPA: hypothetical protein VK699_09880 [Terriglobales bacterium]|jgi:hypothetical protein|nr:hypothetical protein [Terriglobales bacterium]